MKKISSYTAILAAIAYAGLDEREAGDISVRRADGFFEVQFAGDWTQYDCFVDETSGEVMGFDARPLPEHVMLDEYSRMTA
ncbi:MAG: hypothetical protein IJU66_10210 [Oscillospiraceae bacterium]|nr:hypothetical protein [Oscillospiraceae bacterium]